MATNNNLKQMTSIFKVVLSAVLLNFGFSGGAQEKFQTMSDSLPLDGSIRYGKLPNGFTYFIKPISEPQSNLFLRFYNKGGANQEDGNEVNLAHGVEHLAFKSTNKFPLGVLNSKRLEELGMGLFDMKASSGRSLTEYSFDAAPGDSAALDFGLEWFREIATGLKLTDKDIDQVRGELRGEYLDKRGDDLYGDSAINSMYSELFPCKADGSNYLELNKNFPSETVRDFYKDWYRPDLLALSVVGNVEDPDHLEKRIKDLFGNIISPEYPRKFKNCDSLYYSRPPQFVAVERQSDPSKFIEDESAKIHLFFRNPEKHNKLYKRSGIEGTIKFDLLVEIISDRLKEATNDYRAHDVVCYNLYKYKDMSSGMELLLSVENGQEERSLKGTIEVLHQLQTYGVSSSEWKRLKEEQLNHLRQTSGGVATYWIDEISKYYIYGEALPSGKDSYLQDWLEQFSLADFNEYVSSFLEKKPEDIGIIAPTNHRILSYNEAEIRSWIEEVYQESIEPREVPEAPIALMEPTEVENLSTVEYVDNGVGRSGSRELVLDNGLKIVLKPLPSSYSDDAQKRIQVHGFSLQGAEGFPEENFSSAINSPAIVSKAGVNGMNRFQLNRFLSKTSLLPGSVSPYVDYQESGIYGVAALEDSEVMMQLIYLYFTRPNKDKSAFDFWKKQEYKHYINPSFTPMITDFHNAIRSHTGDNSIGSTLGRKTFSGTRKYKSIEKTDLDWAYRIYKNIFGNAEDFTFIITGDFDIEQMLPLVQKYLGNLPNSNSSGKTASTKADVWELPQGPSFTVIPSPGNYKLENTGYEVKYIKEADDGGDWQEQLKIKALARIVTLQLLALRFEKGYGFYDVSTTGKYNAEMKRYEIGSYLFCRPEEFSSIRKEVKQVFSDIKAGSISPEEFESGVGLLYSLHNSKRIMQTREMIGKLYSHYRFNQPWVDPLEAERFVKSITVENIVQVARKYFRDENQLEFVMLDRSLQ